jgi:hypothetical protein
VRPSESPNLASCPRCHAKRMPVITTTSNTHRYGVYCNACKCERWFDIELNDPECAPELYHDAHGVSFNFYM